MIVLGVLLVLGLCNGLCPQAEGLTLSATDEQVLAILNNTQIQQDQQLFRGCIQTFFERGYYTPIELILNERDNTDLSNSLNTAIAGRIAKINAFIEVLDMPTANLEPFVKWAQNHTHVFLSFKLSHRSDSPPCVNIKQQKNSVRNIPKTSETIHELNNDQLQIPLDEQPETTQPGPIISSYVYTCECIVSHQRVFFKLALDFWDRLEDIEVKKDGLGTFTIVARKLETKIWRFLEASKKRWQIWEELRTKYDAPMKEFFKIIEDEEDQQARKKKPRKKKKNPVQSNQPNKQTNIIVETPKPSDEDL